MDPLSPTHYTDFHTSTTPSPFISTPDLACIASLSPSLQYPIPTLPPTVSFVQGIEEEFSYAHMAQAPYPPMPELSAENFMSPAKSTAKELYHAPSLMNFVVLRKRGTLGALPEAVNRPAFALLKTYV